MQQSHFAAGLVQWDHFSTPVKQIRGGTDMGRVVERAGQPWWEAGMVGANGLV